MTHDYKKALETVEAYIKYESNNMDVPSTLNAQLETIRKALELSIALQPKPISEYGSSDIALIGRLTFNQWEYLTLAYKSCDDWFIIGDMDDDGQAILGQDEQPTHFYDISALPKPEEKTK